MTSDKGGLDKDENTESSERGSICCPSDEDIPRLDEVVVKVIKVGRPACALACRKLLPLLHIAYVCVLVLCPPRHHMRLYVFGRRHSRNG